MYYDSIQNDIGAERAFLEANRLNVVASSSTLLTEPADVSDVDGAASEPGVEEPIGDGPPGTGSSEAPRMPQVHGKYSDCIVYS